MIKATRGLRVGCKRLGFGGRIQGPPCAVHPTAQPAINQQSLQPAQEQLQRSLDLGPAVKQAPDFEYLAVAFRSQPRPKHKHTRDQAPRRPPRKGAAPHGGACDKIFGEDTGSGYRALEVVSGDRRLLFEDPVSASPSEADTAASGDEGARAAAVYGEKRCSAATSGRSESSRRTSRTQKARRNRRGTAESPPLHPPAATAAAPTSGADVDGAGIATAAAAVSGPTAAASHGTHAQHQPSHLHTPARNLSSALPEVPVPAPPPAAVVAAAAAAIANNTWPGSPPPQLPAAPPPCTAAEATGPQPPTHHESPPQRHSTLHASSHHPVLSRRQVVQRHKHRHNKHPTSTSTTTAATKASPPSSCASSSDTATSSGAGAGTAAAAAAGPSRAASHPRRAPHRRPQGRPASFATTAAVPITAADSANILRPATPGSLTNHDGFAATDAVLESDYVGCDTLQEPDPDSNSDPDLDPDQDQDLAAIATVLLKRSLPHLRTHHPLLLAELRGLQPHATQTMSVFAAVMYGSLGLTEDQLHAVLVTQPQVLRVPPWKLAARAAALAAALGLSPPLTATAAPPPLGRDGDHSGGRGGSQQSAGGGGVELAAVIAAAPDVLLRHDGEYGRACWALAAALRMPPEQAHGLMLREPSLLRHPPAFFFRAVGLLQQLLALPPPAAAALAASAPRLLAVSPGVLRANGAMLRRRLQLTGPQLGAVVVHVPEVLAMSHGALSAVVERLTSSLSRSRVWRAHLPRLLASPRNVAVALSFDSGRYERLEYLQGTGRDRMMGFKDALSLEEEEFEEVFPEYGRWRRAHKR